MAGSNYDTISRIFDTFAVTSRSRYVYIYDINRNLSRWSVNAVDYFGLPGEYVFNAGSVWESHVHPDDKTAYNEHLSIVFSGKKADPEFEYRARNKSGEYVACTCKGIIIKDYAGRPAFFACSITNHGVVNNNDPITGFPNQYEMLAQLGKYKNEKRNYIVLMINYIDFGEINRRFGYEFGNKILKTTANYLLDEFGNTGKCYRGEGTILAYVTTNMTLDEIKHMYQKVRSYTKGHLIIEGKKASADIGGGVIIADDFTVDEHTVYTSAKYALNYSKTERNGNLIIFHNGELENNKNSIELVDEVRSSVLNKCENFYLEYQPIVSSEDNSIVGAEVLIRWKKEPYGVVSPSEFVPWLEQDPVFYTLGNWILEKALIDGLEFRKTHKKFYININLAYMQLERSEFRTTLLEILRRTGYPSTGLFLELSHNVRQLSRDHLKSQVEFLKSCGIKIAVDVKDFADLDLVRQFPVDLIKIDPDISSSIDNNLTNRYVLETILDFADKMSVSTCITGIEDENIAQMIKKYNILSVQGYLYGRPLNLQDFEHSPLYISK
ncbi:MAG: EAL domain-containing protein [Butyrivibrio sp.]|nr:EAL domain-containing protein [Butyrivibrio sp.]